MVRTAASCQQFAFVGCPKCMRLRCLVTFATELRRRPTACCRPQNTSSMSSKFMFCSCAEAFDRMNRGSGVGYHGKSSHQTWLAWSRQRNPLQHAGTFACLLDWFHELETENFQLRETRISGGARLFDNCLQRCAGHNEMARTNNDLEVVCDTTLARSIKWLPRTISARTQQCCSVFACCEHCFWFVRVNHSISRVVCVSAFFCIGGCEPFFVCPVVSHSVCVEYCCEHVQTAGRMAVITSILGTVVGLAEAGGAIQTNKTVCSSTSGQRHEVMSVPRMKQEPFLDVRQ